jgi:hypothetical protein
MPEYRVAGRLKMLIPTLSGLRFFVGLRLVFKNDLRF